MTRSRARTRPEGAADVLPLLRGLPLLAGLPADNLERIANVAVRLDVPAGGVVMEEGSDGDGLYILVEGELEVSRREGAGEIVLAVQGPGSFVGEMSLVERAPRNATVRATRPSELLVIGAAEFHALLAASPAAAMTILRTVASRLRSTEASLRQNAKLASLGTLAAGLAHELNNPAAALSRSARILADAVADLDRAARRIGQLGLDPDLLARLERGGVETDAAAGERPAASVLIRVEDDLTEWLEEHGFDRPFDLAPPLALRGWTAARLGELLAELPREQVDPVVEWLVARCSVGSLVDESRAAAGAVSEIVNAVKAHTYLGQAPVQAVDVREGLESTLVLLRARLPAGIDVVRDYQLDLPRIEAYGSELNQVWSNLLDNAIHAVGTTGTIELRTRRGRGGVEVQVADSGPGIEADLLPRIFDPFFTTRPVGSGAGLGLHVAYTIVRRHGGAIRATSRPGRTVFTVELPLRLRPRGP